MVDVEVRIEHPHASKQMEAAPSVVQDALRRRAKELRRDPNAGTFIVLKQVPHATRRRWEARLGTLVALYKLDLPDGWRALYTTSTDGPLRVLVVFEVVSHREYDRLLGYG
jgi:hypothetical protein